MTNNKYIQSVLAHAITEVKYLDRLETGVDSDSHIFGDNKYLFFSIRKFSAFIARVQHNFLLGNYPKTFHLLNKYNLVTDVFLQYLDVHQELKKIKATNLEKEERFLCFLASYLEQKRTSRYKLILDILNHESVLKRFKQKHKNSKPVEWDTKTRFSMDHPIRINGNFEFLTLHSNPQIIFGSLDVKKNLRYFIKEKTYCYWHQNNSVELSFFEINAQMISIISLINGKNSIKSITTYLENDEGIAAVIALFKMLYDMNFIFFSANDY